MKIRDYAVAYLLGCITAAFLVLPFACTENERAKSFGGTMTIDLECGQQLYDVTWKSDDFWYATRPMPDGYAPTTYTFQADSSWGVFEGTVIINEKECGR